jgi:hypothetical protein
MGHAVFFGMLMAAPGVSPEPDGDAFHVGHAGRGEADAIVQPVKLMIEGHFSRKEERTVL